MKSDKLHETSVPLEDEALETTTGGTGIANPAGLLKGLIKAAGAMEHVMYTVKEGDTLHDIAERYNVDTKVLAAANFQQLSMVCLAKGVHLTSIQQVADHIYPGQVLIVPQR